MDTPGTFLGAVLLLLRMLAAHRLRLLLLGSVWCLMDDRREAFQPPEIGRFDRNAKHITWVWSAPNRVRRGRGTFEHLRPYACMGRRRLGTMRERCIQRRDSRGTFALVRALGVKATTLP